MIAGDKKDAYDMSLKTESPKEPLEIIRTSKFIRCAVYKINMKNIEFYILAVNIENEIMAILPFMIA
jgi:hypothetical protein